MDLFEFITVMISVILALATGQLFVGMARLVQSPAKVRLSTIHSLWVANLFLLTFLHWWSLWDFRELSWTFPSFFFSLIGPSLMFFATTLINPRGSSEDDIDLGEYFTSIRRPFLLVVAVMMVFFTLDGPLFGTEAPFNRLRLAQLLIVGSAIFGVFSARAGSQVVVAILTFASLGLGMTTRFFPGFVS